MQTELFKSEITNNAQNATQVKAEITPIQEWREMLSKTISLRKQESLLLNENQNEIMVYHSGASSIADLKGYIASKTYVGICAIDTSQNALNLLIEYSENGGKVFADSGAFRHFRQKLKRPDTPDLDFNLILEKYHKLVSANEGSHNITVVAPDVVGNQKSSLELLKMYKYELQLLSLKKCKIVIPHQNGDLSLEQYYSECKKLFNFEFIVGLPSNAAAITEEQVIGFIKEVKPAYVHFLGCSERQVIHKALNKSPSTHFSCDATFLRKHVGKGKLLTEVHSQVLCDVTTNAFDGIKTKGFETSEFWDQTEFISDLLNSVGQFTAKELISFAKATNTTPQQLKKVNTTKQLWELLDDKGFGYGLENVLHYLSKLCEKSLSPIARRFAVQKLSSIGLV